MKKELIIKTFVLAIVVLFIVITFTPTIGISNYLDDTTPPITTISTNPPEPDGCNGWYVSNVTITLNATDDLSGVNATYYRINGSDWNKYIFPFIISEDGENILIEFYSVDNAGNVETVKSIKLDIDKTPPEGTVEWEIRKIGCRKWEIIFYINITEDANGMERIDFYINNIYQVTITGPGPTYAWIFTIYGKPRIEFKIIVYDFACNNATFIINGSDLHLHPRFNSVTHYSNYIRFLHFFDKYLLIQNLLYVLRWCN